MSIRKGIGKIFAIAASMFALGASTAQAGNPASMQGMSKEATRPKNPTVALEQKAFPGGGDGDRNPNKHHWGKLNQKKYRKWMRQCPQMRRSKKCRVKKTK